MTTSPSLSRDRLASLPRRRLHGGRNVTKAVIHLVDMTQGPIVVKDVAARSWPVRALLGPLLLDREDAAYRRLEGLQGVPRFLGRIDRMAIALQYIPGRDLAAVRPDELPASFFERLDAVLEDVHRRGVAHGDIHRRDVLVDASGSPWLVDFSTALSIDRDADPLLRCLFGQMCRADRRSVAKLRSRLCPSAAARVPDRIGLYRLGSAAGRLVRRVRLWRRAPR